MGKQKYKNVILVNDYEKPEEYEVVEIHIHPVLIISFIFIMIIVFTVGLIYGYLEIPHISFK